MPDKIQLPRLDDEFLSTLADLIPLSESRKAELSSKLGELEIDPATQKIREDLIYGFLEENLAWIAGGDIAPADLASEAVSYKMGFREEHPEFKGEYELLLACEMTLVALLLSGVKNKEISKSWFVDGAKALGLLR